MSYEAIVCKIEAVFDHPNADRIKLATVRGHQIVVDLDSQIGDIGIFFPTDGQLSEVYAKENDLIQYTDPITGERKGGFFAKNRRVRSQKFRGEKSDGYFAPLDSVRFTGVDDSILVDGLTFSELNGIAICGKYFTPATKNAMKHNAGQAKKSIPTFPKHVDTVQWKYIDSLPEDSIVYLTEKLHGTSGRFGYVSVEVEKPKGFWRNVWKSVRELFGRPALHSNRYEYVLGTRNVVLKTDEQGYYDDESFRRNSVSDLHGKLHKGEILYYELVGYTTTGSIMPSVDTEKLRDKEISKKYGKQMTYTYGTEPGTCDLYVYRIAHTNEDGVLIELPWKQVKARCKELGIKHVPEIWNTIVYRDQGKDWIDLFVNNLMDGESLLDERHIREGVVLRIESEYGTDFVKSKSFTFGVLEGFIKEQDDYIDMEESA